MQKRMRFGGFRLIAMILIMAFMVFPALAQLEQGEQPQSEAILRVAIADLKVQGEQAPAAVREALTAVLPALVDCIQSEYQRVGKVPTSMMLRFNLGGNGKVVWCKVIDPPLKSLDACIGKVLPQIQLPPTGSTLSRVTVLLEAKLDHLLAP